MSSYEVPVCAWGRLNADPSYVIDLADGGGVTSAISKSGQPGLAFGNGRSYGDVCLNPGGRVWRTRRLDRFIAFDDVAGIVRCEAGVLLSELIALCLPRGWFLNVTPGTQFITVGGAIANDVHGKNHHLTGTFGCHVRNMTLARTDGTTTICSPSQNAELFAATIGGLGLTGVIVDAELQLKRVPGPWVDVATQAFHGLDEFFALAAQAERSSEYSVAWIDCAATGRALGRGIFLRGDHSPQVAETSPRRTHRMPVTPPVSLVNGLSLRAFNFAYFHLQEWKQGRSIQHYQPYFYPLDNLLEWNRMYGPRGFYQYQSVVPTSTAADATAAMLDAIGKSGTGSFLAVLKVFGATPSPGMLSFPMPGTTLALDFPNVGTRTHVLFARLDAIVREAGGRIYAAKDARMPRDLFASGYPRVEEFSKYRDPGIESAMARRLF